MSIPCLLDNDLLTSRPDTFLVASLYDIFELSLALPDALEEYDDRAPKASLVPEIIEAYGTSMSIADRISAFDPDTLPSLNVFQPACLTHTHIRCLVELACGPLNDFYGGAIESEFSVGPAEIELEVGSSLEDLDTEVQGTTLRQALVDWINNSSTTRSFVDTCYGPTCNPSCPAEIEIEFANGSESALPGIIIGLIPVFFLFFIKMAFCYKRWKVKTSVKVPSNVAREQLSRATVRDRRQSSPLTPKPPRRNPNSRDPLLDVKKAPAEMTLRVRNLDYDVVLKDGEDAGQTKRILSDVTVDFPTGKITAIMVRQVASDSA